ncbi:hypothetical protein J5N97_010047 [Dioscorea zingiberensis]|uniref:Proline-tRNA ligase class II C-terminal domain-containing protein n=1 Tax=Dioscorea zingiberensis TaxID=325984 RepID=A0A9D5CZX7_9LILI|nr:hypothetical protein J5N97_010047 [Dioscorea zingiberensis]
MRRNRPSQDWIRMPNNTIVLCPVQREAQALAQHEARDVEKDVKSKTKGELGAAKTLCTPFDQPELPEGTLCFASGKPAKKWTYWGRSN